ncbi:MAG: Flp family type IVb pilin [Rhodospirillales bacterium]|nr:Flp family type IVb pilin [Rhodospirillales bacterium]
MDFTAFIKRFRDDQSGVTMIEYGLITALISVVILGVLIMTGNELGATFDLLANTLKSA